MDQAADGMRDGGQDGVRDGVQDGAAAQRHEGAEARVRRLLVDELAGLSRRPRSTAAEHEAMLARLCRALVRLDDDALAGLAELM
ncbi:MAG TPA: hypothetical protein PKC84_18995, partial [Paracoccaceae bacterium]|nr:hypothetical protein [Paracoccaceae bacterium]